MVAPLDAFASAYGFVVVCKSEEVTCRYLPQNRGGGGEGGLRTHPRQMEEGRKERKKEGRGAEGEGRAK